MAQGEYGPCSGTPDAGQVHQCIQVRRQVTGEIAHDKLRGPVHIPCPGVIPQSCPEMQDLVEGCIGQGAGIREPLNKAVEIRYHGFHLGLLQHDLGYPDTVWAGVLLPGEIMPSMQFEPGQ